MSNIRQSDVKNHLSLRFRTKIHLCEPVRQPDATGFSGADPDAIKRVSSDFAEDFVEEHSSSDLPPESANQLARTIGPQASATSKSVQS